jgi:lipopolysaccharide transport system permease protein
MVWDVGTPINRRMPQTESAGATKARRVKLIRPPSLSLMHCFRSLASLAQYVDLLLTLSMHRLKVRYKQSLLGWAWALLQPLALMAVYTVIFSMVTKVPSEGLPYSVFVYAALLPWAYFSTALTASAASLVTHQQLITKVYFPREILPLSYVAVGVVDFLLASTVLAGLMIYHRVAITANALYLVPILLVETAFIIGLSLLLAAIQVDFRDVGLAMPLLLQLWMFASPVVYPLAQVPARLKGVYLLNPMVGIVENFRRVLLQGKSPDLESLHTAALISFLLLPLAYLYFKAREATIADVI